MDVHVCKHAVCGLKSELRSTTEHSEVMIWGLKKKKKNNSMLLFSLVSSLESTYFDCESKISAYVWRKRHVESMCAV